MTSPPEPPWLDDDQPHEAGRSEAQIRGLLNRLGPSPRHVLDLGCGRGRVLLPLAERGHMLVGMDWRGEAIRHAAHAAGNVRPKPHLAERCFLRDNWPAHPESESAGFDCALCLGNTWMLIEDVSDGLALLRRVAGALRPGGMFIIDDLPGDFWPELAEGNWQRGISPDGMSQIVWAEDEPVFTLRMGDAVDADVWTLTEDDQRYRLWTMGELRLLAHAAGLSEPVRDAEAGLMVFPARPL